MKYYSQQQIVNWLNDWCGKDIAWQFVHPDKKCGETSPKPITSNKLND